MKGKLRSLRLEATAIVSEFIADFFLYANNVYIEAGYSAHVISQGLVGTTQYVRKSEPRRAICHDCNCSA